MDDQIDTRSFVAGVLAGMVLASAGWIFWLTPTFRIIAAGILSVIEYQGQP